jgi:hypothetical protein
MLQALGVIEIGSNLGSKSGSKLVVKSRSGLEDSIPRGRARKNPFIKGKKIQCNNTLVKSFRAYVGGFIIVFLCALFSIRVVTRNTDWNSEIQLYKSALEVCPLSVKVTLTHNPNHNHNPNPNPNPDPILSSARVKVRIR